MARDPHGFRPLVMGEMEISGGRKFYAFASETCAFDLIGAVYLNEVEPGEMVVVGPEGVTRERWAPERPRAQCVFEHVYFSRPDSIVFGRPVEQSREKLGRLLARECPADADLVVPVPDSGVAAAIGYASESGLPFRHGLIRNHYVGRTFIEPSQAIRDFGVKLKLNPVRYLLEGQRVVLVDDSIVRGTTSRKIVRMVRQAGAREVHVRISCPPTVSPCFYGVDTPTRSELIASNHTVDEIRRFLEADSAGLSLACGAAARRWRTKTSEYCYACYTGDYPTELVNIEELVAARQSRRLRMTTVHLDGESLSISEVRRVAALGAHVELADSAAEKMNVSRALIERLAAGEEPIYAVNTGVGLLADVRIPREDLDRLQRNVIRSHAAGVGEPLAREVVRAMMLIRANVLAKGLSGIRPVVARKLCELLNSGVTPVVPSQGSVGAFGRPGSAGAHGAGADRRRRGGVRWRRDGGRAKRCGAPESEPSSCIPRKASASSTGRRPCWRSGAWNWRRPRCWPIPPTCSAR